MQHPAANPWSIRTEHLSRRYGDLWAVRDVNLEVAPGELFGLLGPNGAGKTTLFNLLSCQLKPNHGSATVGGLSITKQAGLVKQRIGIVPQEVAAYEKLTAWENLVLFAELYKIRAHAAERRAQELLRMVSLERRAHDIVANYSGGMKHRLNIILGLVHDPPVVFFDEPTTGLDPIARRELWEIIRGLRKRGKTIVLTTHYMQEAEELCDRVSILNQGRVVLVGAPKKLGRTLEETFFQCTTSDSPTPHRRVAA